MFYFSRTFLTLACCAALSPLSAAESAVHINNEPDNTIKVAQPSLPTVAVSLPQPSSELPVTYREMSDQELAQNPALARQLLNELLDTDDAELLGDLLAIYKNTPNPDTILIDYAEGALHRLHGRYGEAIAIYRRILAANPDFSPVRLSLAQSLYADYQSEAALDQFKKIRAENPPPEIVALADQYIEAIQRRGAWDFSFYVNYLKENNVNNASSSKVIRVGNVPFEKSEDSLPQSATGFQYGFNVSRNVNLGGQHYLRVENDFFGKTFWDNHDYDDLLNRTALGYQYQNANNRVAVLPFYQYRRFGGESYSRDHGLRLEYEHWFNPQWRATTALEWGKTGHYKQADRISNSRNRLYSGTLLYLMNAKTFFYAGADYQTEDTHRSDLISKRKSLRLGWGQEWGAGISTRLQLSRAVRNFDNPHIVFRDMNRRDHEYGVSTTIWHRGVHFWGITPKVTWNWRKVDSNLPDLYSYKKNQVFLSFEKTF